MIWIIIFKLKSKVVNFSESSYCFRNIVSKNVLGSVTPCSDHTAYDCWKRFRENNNVLVEFHVVCAKSLILILKRHCSSTTWHYFIEMSVKLVKNTDTMRIYYLYYHCVNSVPRPDNQMDRPLGQVQWRISTVLI